MRFFKGSKVEVLQKAEAPLGSWRPAEIVSGNGHSYLVRYNQSLVDHSVAVEKVPRRLMRPCPPPSDSPVCWTVGSILEAFDTYSWKVCEVVRVLGNKHYLVRLLGSSLEMKAHASDLRLGMLWQDDKWIVTRKYSGRCSDGLFRSQSKGSNVVCKLGKNKQLHSRADKQLSLENQIAFDGDMSRGLKRKSSNISTKPPCSEINKRLQTPCRDGIHLKLVDRGSLHLDEKVDVVDSPCLKQGEKYMHSSLNIRNNGDLKTNLSKVNADDNYNLHTRTIADLSDTESISSSVGSSSPNSSPHRSNYYNLAHQNGDVCSRTDDAEASTSEREISEHGKDGLREETHLLELHAYRATLLALYACGSLSWEQEALLTNLRLNLNISTDEHLAELRKIVFQAVTSR